jgi:hypothetical protein
MSKLSEMIDRLGLAIHSNYIPMERDEEPRLKWNISLFHGGSKVLNCTYTAGIGHAPSYPAAVAYDECRHGLDMRRVRHHIPDIKPDQADVVRSIVMDGRALDFSCFEDWANEFGFDTDSRKAEAMYKQCLSHGLMLRASLGRGQWDELCDAVNEE